jgi:uncharacterized protein YdhG (YjbR/CyaY superfamily)
MGRSKDVDAWFSRYENPMKDVVQRMRAIILGADARVEECIKWQAPTFTYRGNLASFCPKSKQHASLMFHVGAKIPGKHPRLEGSGGTSRVMKIASVAEANAAKRDLERIVEAWCAWRDEAAGGAKTEHAAKRTTAKRASRKASPVATKRRTAKRSVKR